jgi:hypothetical protein
MIKVELVTSYLSRFTQTHDELATIGEIVDPKFRRTFLQKSRILML